MSDTIEGLDNLDGAISSFLQQLDEAAIEATDAAAQVVAREVRTRAKGSIKGKIAVNTYRKRGGGAKGVIEVADSGPDSEEHHAVFLEYGTSRMAAQPFMRPAFEASASSAESKFTEVFTEKLRG